VNASCSVYSAGQCATAGNERKISIQMIDNIICFGNLDDRSIVNTIFSSIGSCEGEIDENLLNVVTALSGSGPAYVSEANSFLM
jgi:hypothetical protein